MRSCGHKEASAFPDQKHDHTKALFGTKTLIMELRVSEPVEGILRPGRRVARVKEESVAAHVSVGRRHSRSVQCGTMMVVEGGWFEL